MQFHLVSHHGQLCKSKLEQVLPVLALLLEQVLPVLALLLEQEQLLAQALPEPLLAQVLPEPLDHEGCHFPKQIFQPTQTSPRRQLVRWLENQS
jgi:hypothetical protein